jgi:hypothetical protein
VACLSWHLSWYGALQKTGPSTIRDDFSLPLWDMVVEQTFRRVSDVDSPLPTNCYSVRLTRTLSRFLAIDSGDLIAG